MDEASRYGVRQTLTPESRPWGRRGLKSLPGLWPQRVCSPRLYRRRGVQVAGDVLRVTRRLKNPYRGDNAREAGSIWFS